MPRRPQQGARVVYQGFAQARSTSHQDRARAIRDLTERQIGDGPRWSVRRVYERTAYDMTLRLVTVAVGVAFMLVLLLGIFG